MSTYKVDVTSKKLKQKQIYEFGFLETQKTLTFMSSIGRTLLNSATREPFLKKLKMTEFLYVKYSYVYISIQKRVSHKTWRSYAHRFYRLSRDYSIKGSLRIIGM